CFFFQAEDGIRDLTVTGVQTCALPISRMRSTSASTREPVLIGSVAAISGSLHERVARAHPAPPMRAPGAQCASATRRRAPGLFRSEERRVGKEGRYRRWG